MNTRVKGFIYLLLSAVYFGFMPLLVKVICADGSTIVGALFLRFALAIIPLYIYLKVRKVPMELSVEEGGRKKDFVCDGVWIWNHSASFVQCVQLHAVRYGDGHSFWISGFCVAWQSDFPTKTCA